MEEKEKHIVVTVRGEKRVLAPSQILYLQSARSYTVVHMQDSTQYLSCVYLGAMSKLLSKEMFLRVHRSHIVNMTQVKAFKFARSVDGKEIRTRGGKVLLSNNKQIEVSQRKKSQLLQYLKNMNRKAQAGKKQIKNDPRAALRIHPGTDPAR